MNEHDELHDRAGDFALDEPLPLGAREPVDVVQVRADEAFIAALGRASDVHVDDPVDERLAGLLQSWREDVHAEPEPPLIDLDTAMAAVASGTKARIAAAAPYPRRSGRSVNPLGPLATAAAVLVIAFIGIGLAARGAEPGDALWGVTKVLYSDKARSVEAAVTVRAKLDEANDAIQSGNIAAAMIALQEAQQKLKIVAPEDGKDQLKVQTEQLMAEVVATPSAPPPVPTTTPSSDTGAAPPAASPQPVPPAASPTEPPASPTAEPSPPPPATTPPSVAPPPPTQESQPVPNVTDPGAPRSGAGTDPPANSRAKGARGRP